MQQINNDNSDPPIQLLNSILHLSLFPMYHLSPADNAAPTLAVISRYHCVNLWQVFWGLKVHT